MNRRSRRTARHHINHKHRVTARDLWIIEALAKMRFLTTTQLAKLFFAGSRWSANKRLRKLLDAGLLKVWLRNLYQDNVYSLSRRALGALDQSKTDLRAEVPLPRQLDGNLDHLLSINEVRLALALGLFGTDGEIRWWKSDWELRAVSRDKVIPDAIFMIRWENSAEQTYALELDNQTRSTRNFLTKIMSYVSRNYRAGTVYGVAAPTILVVGKDPKWLERYRSLAVEMSARVRIWFTTLAELEVGRVEGQIWKATGDKKYSLRELSFLPNSKEGCFDERAAISID